jgi:serine/threonine-protein kinase
LGDRRALDEATCKRIEREAKTMARLRGTSAVYVHALEQNDDGMLYLAMEMLHGSDLEDYLKKAEARGGRIKPQKLMEILRPVVDTLEAAHAQGIVHRDIKPSNVFLVDANKGGGVRLLDFGLAKVLGEGTLTETGFVAGTPSYIAPEGWKGDPKLLDHRIDVYSLGVVIFRALAGKLPAPAGGVLDVYKWATLGQRPSLKAHRTSLPDSVDGWVKKALAVDREERFQSVRDLWQGFEKLFALSATRSPF